MGSDLYRSYRYLILVQDHGPHQQEVLLSSHLSEGKKRAQHFLIMICPIMPSPYLTKHYLRRAPN
jgi:hypothetical protein